MKFAIGYSDIHNRLSIEILEGKNWKEAFYRHTIVRKVWGGDSLSDPENHGLDGSPVLPGDLDEAKEYVEGFCDFEFYVTEI